MSWSCRDRQSVVVFYCVECCGRHTQAMRKVLGCLGICSQSGLGPGLGRRGLGPKSASKANGGDGLTWPVRCCLGFGGLRDDV